MKKLLVCSLPVSFVPDAKLTSHMILKDCKSNSYGNNTA